MQDQPPAMKPAIIISFLVLFVTKVFGQTASEKFESALMEMKGGAEVVYTSDKHSFTLDILSNNIKPQDKPGFVNVDNKVLQFIVIPNQALKDNADTAFQKAELRGYTKYELDYAKNDLKVTYSNLKYEWIILDKQLFLLWYYDMPPAAAPEPTKKGNTISVAEKQINLSSICFAHVLNLNTPFLHGDNFDEDKAMLLKVAKTLKLNYFKLDFNEVYKRLHP